MRTPVVCRVRIPAGTTWTPSCIDDMLTVSYCAGGPVHTMGTAASLETEISIGDRFNILQPYALNLKPQIKTLVPSLCSPPWVPRRCLRTSAARPPVVSAPEHRRRSSSGGNPRQREVRVRDLGLLSLAVGLGD